MIKQINVKILKQKHITIYFIIPFYSMYLQCNHDTLKKFEYLTNWRFFLMNILTYKMFWKVVVSNVIRDRPISSADPTDCVQIWILKYWIYKILKWQSPVYRRNFKKNLVMLVRSFVHKYFTWKSSKLLSKKLN